MTPLLSVAFGLQPTLTTGARRASDLVGQVRAGVIHAIDLIQPGIPCEPRQCSEPDCGRVVTKLSAVQVEPFKRPDLNEVPVPVCGLNGCPGELRRILDPDAVPRFTTWDEA